jgi:hypothetical protein
MTQADFQAWLNEHGASLLVDNLFGPRTRSAVLALFSNMQAPAVTENDIGSIADRLRCSVKQVKAVARVESGGSAFDHNGRPKILFERHYFHRLTEGRWSVAPFSNSKAGGYSEDSWQKLADACARDPWAAFQSASWGRFQVMGSHWKKLGYLSPLSMAWLMRQDEYGHYEALARYVEAFGLLDEMRALSSDPDDCRGFARLYNGPGYAAMRYHEKLAEAMR